MLTEVTCHDLQIQLSLIDIKERDLLFQARYTFILGQKLAAQSSKNDGKDSLGNCYLKSNKKNEDRVCEEMINTEIFECP